MNRLLVLLAFAAVILSTIPGGEAGLAYAHRYYKKHPRSLSIKLEENILKPRGKITRRSCRARPSSSIIASSTQEPSSAIVTPSVNPLAISFSPDTPSVTPAALSTTTSTTNTPLNTSSSTTVFVQTQAQAATTSIVPTTTQAETPSTTAAAPTQSQASSSSSSSSGTSQSDIDQYLNDQNTVRAQHGASAFTWNNTLADAAQKWANGCVFQHSGGTLGPYGENLAAGTGSSYGISAAITSWTSEVSQYNANDPVASHFTQVVWKASTEVGCAVQDCSGIFPASFGLAQYYVCEYFPQGNVIGEFAQNVQV